MIFVDTGAWFALLVPTGRDHLAAESWFERNIQSLVTTDYVIDELLTLLRMRRQAERARPAGVTLFEEGIARIALGTGSRSPAPSLRVEDSTCSVIVTIFFSPQPRLALSYHDHER
jgi:predicted nucleic acid-binding protein